jgi:RNA exonuclease 4
MDPTKLSSNWKALQKSLGSEKKPVKRRRPANDEMSAQSTKRISRPRSKSSSNAKQNQARPDASDFPERPATALSTHQSQSRAEKNEGVSPTALPGKYVALDCEMVGVGPQPDNDHQLARVSLVNWHGEQVYDSFVSPQLPVTDYRTVVSGIRPADLRQGRPFQEVRTDAAVFLKGRILVGHWLKNDLECLQIQHPRSDIRDTAKLGKFRAMVGGGNVRLKDIAKKVLGLDIQTGEHDSVEDAQTAMLLFRTEKDEFDGEKKKQPRLPPNNLMNDNLEENEKDKKKRKKKRR